MQPESVPMSPQLRYAIDHATSTADRIALRDKLFASQQPIVDAINKAVRLRDHYRRFYLHEVADEWARVVDSTNEGLESVREAIAELSA
jgi:hypothetical protein